MCIFAFKFGNFPAWKHLSFTLFHQLQSHHFQVMPCPASSTPEEAPGPSTYSSQQMKCSQKKRHEMAGWFCPLHTTACSVPDSGDNAASGMFDVMIWKHRLIKPSFCLFFRIFHEKRALSPISLSQTHWSFSPTQTLEDVKATHFCAFFCSLLFQTAQEGWDTLLCLVASLISRTCSAIASTKAYTEAKTFDDEVDHKIIKLCWKTSFRNVVIRCEASKKGFHLLLWCRAHHPNLASLGDQRLCESLVGGFSSTNFEKLWGKVVKLEKKSPQKNRGFKKKIQKMFEVSPDFPQFPYQNRSQSPHIAQSPCFEAVKNHPHPEQAPEGNHEALWST